MTKGMRSEMENGRWKMENGKWKMENGLCCQMAYRTSALLACRNMSSDLLLSIMNKDWCASKGHQSRALQPLRRPRPVDLAELLK